MIRYIVLAFTAMLLAGCNTADGVGKDVEDGGQAISRTAKKTEQAL